MVGMNSEVEKLERLLGSALTTYVAGLKDTAELQGELPEPIQERLSQTLRVARMIEELDGKAITQAWFQGLAMERNGKELSPARYLHGGGDIVEVERAAKRFLSGGY